MTVFARPQARQPAESAHRLRLDLSEEYQTVIVAMPDLAGRLIGKRIDAAHYRATGGAPVRTCDVVFGWGIGHELLDGFTSVGWEHGYGDVLAEPDPATLRSLAWWPGTALLMADAVRANGEPVGIAPRHILRQQVARAMAAGLCPIIASELEFTLFDESAQTVADKGYTRLSPHGTRLHPELVESTGFDEPLFAALRSRLGASGIPVESIKPEYSLGQFELTVSAAEAVAAADDHTIFKLGVREMCRREGLTASFMAKWDENHGGSGCHLHISLRDEAGENAFGRGADGGPLLHQFIAGLQRYAADVFLLWAPYPNSYKRFRPGTFAPSSLTWGADNRTAALRITGRGAGRHLENRIPGADVNPYLAYTGLLAAGLAGIEQQLQPGEAAIGNAYAQDGLPPLPPTLDAAIDAFAGSAFTRDRLGADVVEHIANFCAKERDASRVAVTDWDRKRLLDI